MLAVSLVVACFLTVTQFATLATGLAIAGILTAILDLGASTLLTRDGAPSRSARGALLKGSLRARMPIFAAVLLLAPLIGAATGEPLAAIGVAALAIGGAVTLSVLGAYRSRQDIRPEAVQKLAAAALSVSAAVGIVVLVPRGDVLLLGLAAVSLATLVPLVVRLPAVADFDARVSPLAALRRAAPIGLIALGTIAYYRSGTIMLAALSDAQATAAFSVAAAIAFGLLMLPNAITTALLPRLAAEADRERIVASARPALVWAVAGAAGLAGMAAAVIPPLIPVALGPEYTAAALPLAILCLGVPLIAASGVIGTALLAVGRLRALGWQVAVSLAVNLAVLVALVPAAGALGASIATLVCETAGLTVLVLETRSALPGLLAIRPAPPGRSGESPSAALS
jgi:O-antigen/teichoic acid export membrane protein